MATLGDMKARIAEEIFRDDLGSAIAREITSAIRFYQAKRLYFSERYSFGFNTEAGRMFYSAGDAPELANLISIDFVSINQNNSITELRYAAPHLLDRMQVPPSSGIPFWYSYYESALWLYPAPNAVVPVRVAGVVPIAAPTSDDQTGNSWMYDAEELIRSRAKRNLYLHSLGDPEMAAAMKAAEDEAYDALVRETTLRTQVNTLSVHCI